MSRLGRRSSVVLRPFPPPTGNKREPAWKRGTHPRRKGAEHHDNSAERVRARNEARPGFAAARRSNSGRDTGTTAIARRCRGSRWSFPEKNERRSYGRRVSRYRETPGCRTASLTVPGLPLRRPAESPESGRSSERPGPAAGADPNHSVDGPCAAFGLQDASLQALPEGSDRS